MPAFFALTGMRTEIGLLGSADQWLICLLIIAVAILGKCLGTIGAARFRGFNWRDSTCLGLLMNTRGLMEIIVLNIGLEQGIISPQLFTMMVLMALLTTMITGPALEMLRADRHPKSALSG
jgi:Kef-type K+ transport system membrane component KefB